MTKDEAHALIADHDNYVRSVSRMNKTELAILFRSELAKRGRELLYGQYSKGEYISAIVDLAYPLATMNGARQVYYAVEVF